MGLWKYITILGAGSWQTAICWRFRKLCMKTWEYILRFSFKLLIFFEFDKDLDECDSDSVMCLQINNCGSFTPVLNDQLLRVIRGNMAVRSRFVNIATRSVQISKLSRIKEEL